MMYRYGVLSTASIVPRFINALNESGLGKAEAIASRDILKAQEKANEFNIPKVYGSYDELIEDKDIDIVYVAMINAKHYEYALKALKAKKHVICEKPLTLSAKEAKHLFETAKANNVLLMEAQKSVFLPVMQDLRQMILNKELGEIQFCDFTSSCSAVYNKWLHSFEAGGGALAGSASYSIHLAKFLFGEKIENFAGICTKRDSEVDEQCAVTLNLGNKIMFVSKISTNVKAIDRALIFGTNGYVEISEYWKAREATVHFNDGTIKTLSHPCKYELIYEIRHFHECLESGLKESPIMSEEMSVSTLEVLDTLRNSWK